MVAGLDLDKYGQSKAQRVRIDIEFADWQFKAIEAVRDAASRRGTKVISRPKPSPPTAITQTVAM